MNRIIKIVLAVIGVLVALVVIAAIVLPMVIDANDFKDDITAAVAKQTGRELTIPGDIELSVFPWLGVKLGAAQLSNAKGFGDKPFAAFKSAQLRVKLLPLLSKHIEIGTVSLDGLRLRLARNAKGRTNWDDLVERFSSKQETTAPKQPEKKTEGGFTLPQFEVGSIDINDAAVFWDDATTGESYKLTDVNLSTGRLTSGSPFRLELGFALQSEKPALAAKTHLAADVSADIAGQFYRLHDLSLNVHASGKAVPGGQQQFELTGNAQADLSSDRLKVNDLMLQGAGVTVTGNMDGNGLTTKPSFNGRITVRKFNPRTVMKQLDIEPPKTSDDSALTSAGLDAQFEATPRRIALKQILIDFDQSTLKGDATVNDFANPAIAFHLALDHFNVDHYLPPGSSNKQTSNPKEATSGEINVDALKGLKLDGRISADKITAYNLKINDAELAVTARNGVLQVQPLSANLYDGNLRMDSRVDAATKRPSYAIKGNLNGLKFGPLLSDLIGTDKVNGLANINLDLTTAGNTVTQMKRALNGTVSFELRDGAFAGFDLARLLTLARDRFFNSNADQTGGNSGKTPFRRFAAAFSVADGVLDGKSFALKTKQVNADGGGKYNLVSNNLDYTIKASVPDDVSGDLAKLKGVTIPIKLSGDLFSPDYSIDIASAIKGVASKRLEEKKSELNEKVEKKKQELNEKLQNKVQKGLSNLLGGGKDKPQQQEGTSGSQ